MSPRITKTSDLIFVRPDEVLEEFDERIEERFAILLAKRFEQDLALTLEDVHRQQIAMGYDPDFTYQKLEEHKDRVRRECKTDERTVAVRRVYYDEQRDGAAAAGRWPEKEAANRARIEERLAQIRAARGS